MMIRSLFSRSARQPATREVSALLASTGMRGGFRERARFSQCKLMNRRLVDNGVLASGEVRHCDRWEAPTAPRLLPEVPLPCNDLIYRRQKAFAPKVRGRRGLAMILDAIRQR